MLGASAPFPKRVCFYQGRPSSLGRIAPSAGELLKEKNVVFDEVQRLVNRGGRYTLICTGNDLTTRQRNDSREKIVDVLTKVGGVPYEGRVEVLGASQVSEYAERYPGTAAELARDRILEGLTFEEWRVDSQLENDYEGSDDQIQMIEKIRAGILGKTKHIRILGEPGVGKTRIVLEAVKEKGIAPTVLYVPHGLAFGGI